MTQNVPLIQSTTTRIRRSLSTPARASVTFILSAVLLILAFPAVAAGQTLDVTAYGAKADGVTDDRAAIQRAIDACPAGGTVTLPAGTYRVGSTVNLKSGITIQGAGPEQSILVMPRQASATQMFYGGRLTGTTISQLGFRGSGAFTGNEYGLLVNGATGCTLENLRFSDLRFGMKLGAGEMSSGWMVRDIVARSCRIALFLASCKDSSFVNLNLHGEPEQPSNVHDHTVYINEDVTNCVFNGCSFSGGAGWALQFWADRGGTRNLTFTNTVIDARNGNHPIVVGPSFSDITFTNTTIYAKTGDSAVWFYGGSNFTFDGFAVTGAKNLVIVDDNLPVSGIQFKNGTFTGTTLLYNNWGAGNVLFQNVTAPQAPTTTTQEVITTTTTAPRPTTTTTTEAPPTTTTAPAVKIAPTTTIAPVTTTTRAPATTVAAEPRPTTTTTTVPPTTTTTAVTAAPPTANAPTTTTSAITVTLEPGDATPPQTQAPSSVLTMASPADGETVGGRVSVRLTVASETPVAKAHFQVDGRPTSLDYRAPYGFTWNTAWTAPGSAHTITGVAYDKQGREIGRASSRVTVAAGEQSRLPFVFPVRAATTDSTDPAPDAPYYEAVSALVESGAISGFADGQIGAERPINRAQFAKVASIVLGIDVEETTATPFRDLDDPDKDLYPHKYVAALYGISAIFGTTPTEFSPWNPLTRAQLVSMLVRAIETLDPGVLAVRSSSSLSVHGDFSEDHARAMAIAEASGLLAGIEGYGEDWDPWALATRGETAQIVQNLIGL